MPQPFNISAVYPNPFNPKVNIEVDIASSEIFNLSIYDLQGALVQELYDGTKGVGRHLYSWDASAYSSGIYFVRLTTNEFYKYNKIMLVK